MNEIEFLNENEQVINQQQLFYMLVNYTQSGIVSVEYITDDTRSKQVKGVKQVQKHVKISNLFLNHKYENKVRNLTGDTEFKSEELKGKSRISSTIIQSDKTLEKLLDGKILNSESVKIINYFHKGEIITESEAVAKDLWAGSYYSPTEKKTAGRGLVSEEKDFKMITLSLSKILKIKFKGTLYTIE
jgi:hypothetical protein